jgi:hypothetical protein
MPFSKDATFQDGRKRRGEEEAKLRNCSASIGHHITS